MGRLIEQQAVIDCLTNTAKYFDMPQADEWTKGIHYGLIHGLDNILDNVPTVEAIPKEEVRQFIENIQKIKDNHNEYGEPINYGTICGILIEGYRLLDKYRRGEEDGKDNIHH